VGAPSFGYFSWQDKKSDLPPGNPRRNLPLTRQLPYEANTNWNLTAKAEKLARKYTQQGLNNDAPK
jgi:hypothetical protein